ncbi:hypothetical protein E1176_01370, partial [Fulvivirga sp. RKSG066]|uniref:SprB repeat-containing protein n=1 Tax=Fulvivirga aurantia TaxID=2529383 RepID=UPI001629A00B
FWLIVITSLFYNASFAQLSIAVDKRDPTCIDESDGRIKLTVTGGSAPYIFDWSTGSSRDHIINLSGGLYTCIVTDSNGTTQTINVNLMSPKKKFEVSLNKTENSSYQIVSNMAISQMLYIDSEGMIHKTFDSNFLFDERKVLEVYVTNNHGCTSKISLSQSN